MEIDRNSHVTFDFILRNEAGELIEASETGNPPFYIHGYGQLLPGLEKHMKGHKVGDKFDVDVPAKFGYGERDENLIVTVPVSEVPEDAGVAVGQTFDAVNDHGHKIKLTVKEVNDKEVTMDANHPLAGVDLKYEISVQAMRPATEEELMEVAAPSMGTDKGLA